MKTRRYEKPRKQTIVFEFDAYLDDLEHMAGRVMAQVVEHAGDWIETCHVEVSRFVACQHDSDAAITRWRATVKVTGSVVCDWDPRSVGGIL